MTARKMRADVPTRPANTIREKAQMQSTEQLAFNSTGEFAAHRRRAYEIPADLPPEKARIKLRAEVENSLRDICGNLPTGEFDRIVAEVTATTLKYRGHERRRTYERQSLAGYVPGVTVTAALMVSAMQSVQKFLQLETLPLR